LPTFISHWFYKGSSQKTYSHWGTALAGSLTFFLPCGFTQAMQIYALASGTFWSGALIMSLFALGTSPALFGLGALTSVFSGKKSQLFFKVVGVGVIILAVVNINSGLRLLGWSGLPANSSTAEQRVDLNWQGRVEQSGVQIVDGVQIVKMAESARGYSPNQFVIKKGLPVRWVINAQNTFTCASSLLVPALKIQKNLTAGENVIEFTPKQVGRLNFSCSMGMYGGQFEVIE
ncbi:MAG: sulfite exporter TauE/SafE family protein, partial [Candidatus Komeilibacteria bacterium]|nr:sulfite exporter TauE/SafE family protein [Candidatus Komeilibacteria bacterium]